MVSASDLAETQVMDSDSDTADGGSVLRSGDEAAAMEETQMIHGDEETQLMEDLDGFGGRVVTEIGDWEETQLVDDGGDGDDGSRDDTEVLADEEDARRSKDCEVEKLATEEVESENREEDRRVDSGASTDEHDKTVRRRSFTAVRSSALRSIGLASLKSVPKTTESNPKIFGDCGPSEMLGSDHGRDISAEPRTPVHGACLVARTLEIHGDNGYASSAGCTSDRCRRGEMGRPKNSRVRKLFDDVEVATSELEPEIGVVDFPRLQFSNQSVAGLSYLGSQEPGSQSQAHAFEVVDNFLLVNDAGSSPKTSAEDDHSAKFSVILNAKGAQSLARLIELKSPVEREGIYEWNDRLEDEGGGEFFTKSRDLLFGSGDHGKKSSSARQRAKTIRNTIQDHRKDANVNGKHNLKAAGLAHSDSRLELRSSVNVNNHIPVTKTRKNLLMNLGEEGQSRQTEQQTHAGGPEALCSVGPDTQMAAEAMEALCHAFEVSNHDAGAHSPGAVAVNPSEDILRNNNKPKKNPLQKATPSNNCSGEISLRSKSIKKAPTVASNRGSTMSSRNSRKLENSKNQSGTKGVAEVKRQRETFIKEIVECENTVIEDSAVGNNRFYCTPIAHRTRHSDKKRPIKRTKTSSSAKEGIDVLRDDRAPNNIQKDDKLVGIASETTGNVGNALPGPDELADHPTDLSRSRDKEKLPEDNSKTSSRMEDVVTRTKRRRISHNTSRNTTSDVKSKNPSVLTNNLLLPFLKDSKRPRTRHFIKSVSVIRDRAIQRRTHHSLGMQSAFDGATNGTTKASLVAGARMRSSFSDEAGQCRNNASKNLADVRIGAIEDGNLESSPDKEVFRSSNTSVKDVDASSPVVIGEETKVMSNRKESWRPALAKELSRLVQTKERSPRIVDDLRKRKVMTSSKVMFSHHLDEDIIKQQKKILRRLGVSEARSMLHATHFVADRFVRTRNMLEAMVLGKPVVTPMWLECCGQARCFIDEKNYILRDPKKEKEIGFSMPISLARACQFPLLQGRRVFISSNVKPDRGTIASLVKEAQGQPTERIGRSAFRDGNMPDDLLVISCEEDYSVCVPFLEKGGEVFSSELILNGIVVQKLELERHRLFEDHVKKTRSTIWLRNEGKEFVPVKKLE